MLYLIYIAFTGLLFTKETEKMVGNTLQKYWAPC